MNEATKVADGKTDSVRGREKESESAKRKLTLVHSRAGHELGREGKVGLVLHGFAVWQGVGDP